MLNSLDFWGYLMYYFYGEDTVQQEVELVDVPEEIWEQLEKEEQLELPFSV